MQRLGPTGDTGLPVPPLNRGNTVSFPARKNLATESINIDKKALLHPSECHHTGPTPRSPVCHASIPCCSKGGLLLNGIHDYPLEKSRKHICLVRVFRVVRG
jgi:hypothetical protein